jgi:hypothetical protein
VNITANQLLKRKIRGRSINEFGSGYQPNPHRRQGNEHNAKPARRVRDELAFQSHHGKAHPIAREGRIHLLIINRKKSAVVDKPLS